MTTKSCYEVKIEITPAGVNLNTGERKEAEYENVTIFANNLPAMFAQLAKKYPEIVRDSSGAIEWINWGVDE